MAEGRVGTLDELLEVGAGDLVGGDEEGVELEGEVGEGEVGPVVLPVLREGREVLRDVETSVGSESSEDSLREARSWA